MMIVQGKLPRKLYIACSGGVDSMAATDFLRRKHDITLLFFHHGTQTSRDALNFLQDYSHTTNIPLIYKRISDNVDFHYGMEGTWREERYSFLDLYKDRPVITSHHLDDCVETWVWSSMHGTGKIVPYSRGHVIRPFRETRKHDMIDWCVRHNVPWIEDQSNADTKHVRNFVRNVLMPDIVSRVNPGIHSTIRRKVKDLNDPYNFYYNVREKFEVNA